MPTIGILRETNQPLDRRVALTPEQIAELQEQYPACHFIVQPSEIRGFTNREYEDQGIELNEDLSQCELLIGIKEVDINMLIPGKTYMFFSHTAKKQPHNKKLLQEIIKKKITLIDMEYLTDENSNRLVAFGRWAGIVGAYNGLRAYGQRNELYDLKPVSQYITKNDLFRELTKLVLPPVKILITGGGRVAGGVREVLAQLEIHKVSPSDFLKKTFEEPVFSLIEPVDYVRRIDNAKFDLQHFFQHPEEYKSTFLHYTKVTDILMASQYWDPRSPVFVSLDQMQQKSFHISVIADISCDIPGPIPSTIRTSTIEAPFYGFDPQKAKETPPFEEGSITIMAVDNLPSELPRDASEDFGKKISKKVLPSIITSDENEIIARATMAKNGKLTENFSYLQDFIAS